MAPPDVARVISRLDALQAEVVSRYLAGEAVRVEAAELEGGLCAETDSEAFYPEKGESAQEGKAVCGRCDIRELCLEFALTHDERFGIWGGMSARHREVLLARRHRLESA